MNENQSTENFDPTLNKILKFKESLKSADAKNNTFLSIDSAVWYIEALLNYNYCVIKDSSEIYPNTKMDSTFTEININNNKISFSDVARTYFQIEKTILTGLDNLNSENKRVSIVDVSFKNNKFISYFIFSYENKINKGGVSPPSPWNGFSEEYYYDDAAYTITYRVNKHIMQTTPAGFYTDIESYQYDCPAICGPDFNNPNSDTCGMMEYYIFYEACGYFNPYGYWSCLLLVREMNFYYNGAFIAADIVKNYEQVADNKRFMEILLWPNYMPAQEPYYPIMHGSQFFFAQFHYENPGGGNS